MVAIMRTSTLIVLVAADPLEFLFLEHAEQLGLKRQGISVISSSRRVPPLASSKRPSRFMVAPGERAFFVAEEFAFEEISGTAAQLTLM